MCDKSRHKGGDKKAATDIKTTRRKLCDMIFSSGHNTQSEQRTQLMQRLHTFEQSREKSTRQLMQHLFNTLAPEMI